MHPVLWDKSYPDPNLHRIRFPIICGSANNQLIQENCAEILQQKGILYVPDYLANSGGVINVAAEIDQIYDRQDVETRVGLLTKSYWTYCRLQRASLLHH